MKIFLLGTLFGLALASWASLGLIATDHAAISTRTLTVATLPIQAQVIPAGLPNPYLAGR